MGRVVAAFNIIRFEIMNPIKNAYRNIVWAPCVWWLLVGCMHAVVVHSPHQQQQQKWESHRRLLLLYRKSTNLKLAKVRTRMWLVGSRYQRSVLAPFVFTSGKHILEKTGVRLFALRFMFLNGMTTRRCCATHTHTPVVSHSPKSLFLLYSCIINSNRFLAPSFFKHCTVAGAPLPLAMHTITHTLAWAWAYTLALLHPHAHHSTHLILQTEWERERESCACIRMPHENSISPKQLEGALAICKKHKKRTTTTTKNMYILPPLGTLWNYT